MHLLSQRDTILTVGDLQQEAAEYVETHPMEMVAMIGSNDHGTDLPKLAPDSVELEILGESGSARCEIWIISTSLTVPCSLMMGCSPE